MQSKAFVAQRPMAIRSRPVNVRPLRNGVCPRASNVGEYLAEAARQIFSPMKSNIDWDARGPQPFSGRISHEDRGRVGTLYEIVRNAREGKMELVTGQVSQEGDAPKGLQEQGTAYELDAQGRPVGIKGDVADYLNVAIQRIFNHNFKGDDTEPHWTTVPFTGKVLDQREIQRMLHFEKVIKKTLDKE